MVNLSELGNLKPVDTLEVNGTYAVTKEKPTFVLPPKGRYTLQSPDQFPASSFSRTKAGVLQAQIDPTITGPTFEGFTLRFVKVSAKIFDRAGKRVSQVGDYLKAVGFQGVLRSEQEIADAVESTAGAIYEANLDWRAYNSKTNLSVEGMENFPPLADGTYQSWVEDKNDLVEYTNPNTGETTRRPKRVFANLFIPLGGFIEQGK